MDFLSRDAARNAAAFEALAKGNHADPFAILGLHRAGNGRVVRAFHPAATLAEIIDPDGKVLATMQRMHPDGVFTGQMPPRKRRYRLRFSFPDGNEFSMEDPYRFAPVLSGLPGDAARDELGARVIQHEGVSGTCFAVWAPNAMRVSVVGDWNDWDGRVNVMRRHAESGSWEIFLPQVQAGALYKFELLSQDGRLLPLKSDPHAVSTESLPGTASIVYQSEHNWNNDE